MGGCYSGGYSYRSYSEPKVKTVEQTEKDKCTKNLKKFVETKELSDLILAYKSFFNGEKNGFFAELAKKSGISKVSEIPKEFDGIEYEIKFNIEASGKGQEPSVEKYMDAFDFPIGANARFLKDPVNAIATGTNHFFGNSLDEKLVVIEKGGKTYLKEKGKVVPVKTGIPYENIVIKRTEERYESSVEGIIKKITEISSEDGVKYKGAIVKEKGDFFILDTNDGRIYSASLTRAKMKDKNETQRQLEFEYAGYIPGFSGFQKDSEKQIVKGMIDLAKYTKILYDNAPIANGWLMKLDVTSERKYDFVKENGKREIEQILMLPEIYIEEKKESVSAKRQIRG